MLVRGVGVHRPWRWHSMVCQRGSWRYPRSGGWERATGGEEEQQQWQWAVKSDHPLLRNWYVNVRSVSHGHVHVFMHEALAARLPAKRCQPVWALGRHHRPDAPCPQAGSHGTPHYGTKLCWLLIFWFLQNQYGWKLIWQNFFFF